MRILPATACRSRENCRSVDFSAESGMLLISPIVNSGRPSSRRSKSSCPGASAGLSIGRCLSNTSVMSVPVVLFGRHELRGVDAGPRKRLVEILDDVGDMLDADGQPDRLG